MSTCVRFLVRKRAVYFMRSVTLNEAHSDISSEELDVWSGSED